MSPSITRQALTVDDLDSTPIEDGGGTIRFAIDGANFEIDLSAENVAKLTEALKKYTGAGRRVRNGSNAPVTAAKKSDPQRLKAIRERAGDNSYEVSSRGRIPSEVVDAYNAAH